MARTEKWSVAQRKAMGIAIALALAGMAGAARAADDRALDFNLPQQDLGPALNSLALQADRQLIFEDAMVSGRTAPAVVGHVTTADALRSVLRGTGLDFSEDEHGTIVIRRAAPVPVVRRSSSAAPAVVAPVAPVAAAVTSLPVAAPVYVEGDWVARLRGVSLHPANHSDGFSAPGPPPATVAANDVTTQNRWLAGLGLEYFLSHHWSTEIAVDLPQRFRLDVDNAAGAGAAAVGKFQMMPATWTLKYHFMPDAAWRPYIGAGLDVTSLSSVRAGAYGLEHTNVGPAAQAGFDLRLSERWFLNADVRWAQVRPDFSYQGSRLSTMRIDPLLYGFGVSYRFGGHTVAAAAPVVPPPVVAATPPPPPAPPADADGDGVPDSMDQCPNTAPGVKVDAVGCPLDSDHDGVPDYIDKCPGTPRDLKVDAVGCEIEEYVLRGVNFETASAKLAPQSLAVLDDVVGILRQRPGATTEVRGYTDSVGNDPFNQKLSERRARAVVEYLVSQGIPATQLTSAGFGRQNPIASNATAEGRAQNRRVTLSFGTLLKR